MWKLIGKDIWRKVVVFSFLSMTIIKSKEGGYVVKINGREVKKIYSSLEEAKITAVKGSIKLLKEGLDILEKEQQ